MIINNISIRDYHFTKKFELCFDKLIMPVSFNMKRFPLVNQAKSHIVRKIISSGMSSCHTIDDFVEKTMGKLGKHPSKTMQFT